MPVQIPAVAPLVPATLRQRHDVHPGVIKAEAAQQHRPKQRFEPQSNDEEHGSPGLERRQDPNGGTQDEQPSEDDEFEQQYPPRHARDEHVLLEKQAVPAAEEASSDTVVETHALTLPAPAYIVIVLAGHGIGADDPAGQ